MPLFNISSGFLPDSVNNLQQVVRKHSYYYLLFQAARYFGEMTGILIFNIFIRENMTAIQRIIHSVCDFSVKNYPFRYFSARNLNYTSLN